MLLLPLDLQVYDASAEEGADPNFQLVTEQSERKEAWKGLNAIDTCTQRVAVHQPRVLRVELRQCMHSCQLPAGEAPPD